jgi:hypothetical protein
MDDQEQFDIDFDNLFNYDEFEVYETKLGNSSSLQVKKFNSETYKPEANQIIKNEKGQEESKNIPLQSFVRWKYSEDKPNDSKEKELDNQLGIKTNKQIISNAKIIEWSDGSSQLLIGNEYYDIRLSELNNIHFGITTHDSIIVNKPIKQRMIITPLDSKREKIAIADAGKVKLAYNFYNPNEYKKDDYISNKLSKAKFKEVFEKATGKKRGRSDSHNL